MTLRVLNVAELDTTIVAILVWFAGSRITGRVGFLRRNSIPEAVVGGFLASLVVLGVRSFAGVEFRFASGLRDLLLLFFFATVGLAAKVSALRAGGRSLLLLCALSALLMVLQNLAGIGIALGFGAHPFYGLLAGSVPFVGGPGTAIAWGKEGEALGLSGASELGVACATLGVSLGGIIAGPVVGWLIRRNGLRAAGEEPASFAVTGAGEEPSTTVRIEQSLGTLLLLCLCVALGRHLEVRLTAAGLTVPSFLTAMIAGIAFTNLADIVRVRLSEPAINRAGEISLQVFLCMSLMGTRFWVVASALGPLLVVLLVQVALIVLFTAFLVFPLMGRDYDAAVVGGGVIGFGMSSMAVAMATIQSITERYGPSPRAVLLISLAGASFVDIANALIVKGFLFLPWFR